MIGSTQKEGDRFGHLRHLGHLHLDLDLGDSNLSDFDLVESFLISSSYYMNRTQESGHLTLFCFAFIPLTRQH